MPGWEVLQLGELRAGKRDPPLLRAEVDTHGVVFHAEYDAEPVLVVGHLIVDGERLRWGGRSRRSERAARQMPPGRGAWCLHSYHLAPSLAGTGGLAGDCSRTNHGCGSSTVETHCIQ